MNINYIHPADQLVMFMQRIYDKGLTTTSGGNLSIMDDDGNIWITPASVDKGTLTRNDIICVKPDGTNTKFDPRTIPESYILLRDVKRLPYGEIYTEQEKAAQEFDAAHPAVMVDNECVIVTGETLLKAFDRLEVMESTAHSIINSSVIGKIVHISDAEVEDLKVAFELVD